MTRLLNLGKWITMVGIHFKVSLLPNRDAVDLLGEKMNQLCDKLDLEIDTYFKPGRASEAKLSEFFIVWALRNEERVDTLWQLTEANMRQALPREDFEGDDEENELLFRDLALKMKMTLMSEADTNYAWLRNQTTPDPSPFMMALVTNVSDGNWAGLEDFSQTLLLGSSSGSAILPSDSLLLSRKHSMKAAIFNLVARVLCLAGQAMSLPQKKEADETPETKAWVSKLIPNELSVDLLTSLMVKLDSELFGNPTPSAVVAVAASTIPHREQITPSSPQQPSHPQPPIAPFHQSDIQQQPHAPRDSSGELIDRMILISTLTPRRQMAIFRPINRSFAPTGGH